jgi:DNA-binding NarL/FixJ family response regulator
MAIMERSRTDDIDLRVVEPSDGPDVLAQILADVPDVVIVSVRPGPIHPLQLCREMADRAPVSRVLVQSEPDEAAHSYQALRVGAWGCLEPGAHPGDLHDAAEAAARGEAILPGRHAAWLLRELDEGGASAPGTAPSGDRLTASERTVLRLMAEGAGAETIGDHLGVSPRVVGRHAGSAVARLHRRYRRPQGPAASVAPAHDLRRSHPSSAD